MEEKYLKLTKTAYKVLEFFPEQDPLKNKAKEKVLSIMENLPLVLATDGWASLQKEKASSELLLDLDIFLSYLKLAKSQRWIDDINFLILSKEYENIKKEIPPENLTKISIERIKKIAFGQKSENEALKTETEKEAVKAENEPEKVLEKELTERQKRILEMLQENEKAQVSDIIKVLPNITKRTIRRDLDGLLQMGKVVRVGEWNQIFYRAFKDSVRLPQIAQQNTENTNPAHIENHNFIES